MEQYLPPRTGPGEQTEPEGQLANPLVLSELPRCSDHEEPLILRVDPTATCYWPP